MCVYLCVRAPVSVCKGVCTSSWRGVAASRACTPRCQHLGQQGSRASSTELTKYLNPATGSFHTVYIHTNGGEGHSEAIGGAFVCVSADCIYVVLFSHVYTCIRVLFMYVLTVNTGSALLLVGHCSMLQ